ncbi:hypothetical protein LJC59_00895 [Desulfovibrio sp. OttesenSCG-928-A18]|nr:hypothetical protein [Desulfovibrio sp. OttesenSCG-928-A18]
MKRELVTLREDGRARDVYAIRISNRSLKIPRARKINDSVFVDVLTRKGKHPFYRQPALDDENYLYFTI